MQCKYCFNKFGRHSTWCPGYTFYTEEQQKRHLKTVEELRVKFLKKEK